MTIAKPILILELNVLIDYTGIDSENGNGAPSVRVNGIAGSMRAPEAKRIAAPAPNCFVRSVRFTRVWPN